MLQTVLKLLIPLGFLVVIALNAWASSPAEPTQRAKKQDIRSLAKRLIPTLDLKKLKGWDYLFLLLVNDGMDPQKLAKIFSDPRMPKKRAVDFSVRPKESKRLYRKHNSRVSKKNAMAFYKEHHRWFKKARLKFGVSEEIILAILQIETACGGYTGRDRIFYRLARLANVAEPQNIKRNYRKKSRHEKDITLEDVYNRAKWLEATFLPHLAASLVIAEREGVDVLDLRGSPAGALGLPQFLPANYLAFGVDADEDGDIDLFSPPDAIFSVANFLVGHGWKKNNAKVKERRKVVWNYNRSTSYIDAVFSLAKSLDKTLDRFAKEEQQKSLLAKAAATLPFGLMDVPIAK